MASSAPGFRPDGEATETDASALAVETPGNTSIMAVARDFLALTKPKIISLLLVTAAGGMFLAEQGIPSLPLLGLVWAGGALASGGRQRGQPFPGPGTLIAICDGRRGRPVAGLRVAPRYALAFGVALNIVAFVLLATLVNLLAAGLTLCATLFYVFIYTLWLKRTTPNNIVIGGAAGAIPPMVGWAAVTGGLDLPAVYLFAIVFFWTPPHFWALSLLIQTDYERAGVPMLPVVSSRRQTTLHHLALRGCADGPDAHVRVAAAGGADLCGVGGGPGRSFCLVGLEAVAPRRQGSCEGDLSVLAGVPGAAVRRRHGR